MEVWGGATFDACLRYLREDPWERLRAIRKGLPKTKLQMLLRGQNLLGYRIYPDDVVVEFVKKASANGIDIFRVFDALNDPRNLETCISAVKSENRHVQLAIGFTLSPVHTLEYYVSLAVRYMEMGADSLAVKDMAGLLLPNEAYELVKAIKENVRLPLQVHTHNTSGAACVTLYKSVEAGADIIDTAVSPFAMGSSQPAAELMAAVFRGTPYDTGLDGARLSQIAEYFQPLREKAVKDGLLDMRVMDIDIDILVSQVPGGMLSNLVSQLKTLKAEDKYREVMEEIPAVRKDLGYPPLVTPTSQIIGTQAVMNVITGGRYNNVPRETKDLVRGLYGKTPVEIDGEVKERIIGGEEVIKGRPADCLEPLMLKAEEESAGFAESEEDVLSYAMFPNVATDYFKWRRAQRTGIDGDWLCGNVYPI